MEHDASITTGITIKYIDKPETVNNTTSIKKIKTMFMDDEEVISLTPRNGLFAFLHFLKQFEAPVILLAHNCER